MVKRYALIGRQRAAGDTARAFISAIVGRIDSKGFIGLSVALLLFLLSSS